MTNTALVRLNDAKRHLEVLVSRRNQIEGKLSAAKAQFEEASREAKAEFGTDDLDVLRNRVVEINKENEQDFIQFEASLKKFENIVNLIEEALEQPELMATLLPQIEAAMVDFGAAASSTPVSTPSASTAVKAEPAATKAPTTAAATEFDLDI